MARNEKKPNAVQDSRTRDAERALAEQRARTDAVNKNTERLRALRLERDAAAPPQEKVVKQKAKKKQARSLSNYLKQQKEGGRDT